MKCKYPRFMVSAPKSGSGKTMVTCGLLTAFLNRGITCRSFKCGPDYIDPMFHKYVLGIDGRNLDTFFLKKEQVRAQFAASARGAGISLTEGVMGYYDGVGTDSTQASSYEVASALDTPVVLVLDCRGASLSLAALAKGFLEYKPDSRISGVILNRTSKAMAERLKPAMEELGLTVYGYLPECEEGRLEGRHLGLVLPGEQNELKQQLYRLAQKMEETVDIDGLLCLAGSAGDLPDPKESAKVQLFYRKKGFDKVPIGIAGDEAFCFYYQENLKMLEEMGAELIPFSPVHDEHLPENIRGILLGGGYPELYGSELSQNNSMLEEIRDAHARSMPILAECGGFMYLHEEMETKEGEIYSLAGIIKGRVFPTERLLRFGYIEAFSLENGPFLKKGESVKGHEFHYWDSTDNGKQMEARKPGGGNRSWDCVHVKGNLMAGFPHFYYPSNPVLAKRFAESCRRFKI